MTKPASKVQAKAKAMVKEGRRATAASAGRYQDEVEKFMDKGARRNAAIRKRAASRDALKSSRALFNVVAGIPNKNWRFLSERLMVVSNALSFDEYHPTPKANLKQAQINLTAILDKMQEGRLTRLGRFNVRTEVGYVSNQVRSLLEGLKDKAITTERVASLLPALRTKLALVGTEMSLRIQASVNENGSDNGTPIEDAVVARRAAENEVAKEEAAVRDTETFNDFTSAMKRLVATIATKEAEEAKVAEAVAVKAAATKPTFAKKIGAVPPESRQNVSDIRDAQSIESIIKSYRGIEGKIKAAVVKARAADKNQKEAGLQFVVVRGPVAVRTSPQIDVKKLDAMGIKHNSLAYGGIKFGPYGGMTDAERKGRYEYVPRMTILEDQILVCFYGDDPEKVRKQNAKMEERAKRARERHEQNIGRPSELQMARKPAKSVALDADSMALQRANIPAIIGMKTGRQYIDVVLNSTNDPKRFITSTKLPGIRMVWLLRSDYYSKIGSFRLDEIGMPF